MRLSIAGMGSKPTSYTVVGQESESEVNFRHLIEEKLSKINLQKIPSRQAHKQKKAPKPKVPGTSHSKGVNFRDMYESSFAEDNSMAFMTSKLTSLRASPCRVVWPERPPPDCSNMDEVTAAATAKNGPMSAQSDKRRSSTWESINGVSKNLTQDCAYKENDFWDNTRGYMRIDSIFWGTTRFDPYRSTWTPDERRCFFRTFVPKHLVEYDYMKIANEKLGSPKVSTDLLAASAMPANKKRRSTVQSITEPVHNVETPRD